MKWWQRILLVFLLGVFWLEPFACDRGPTRPNKRQDETTEEESRYATPERPPAVQPYPDRR